MPHFSVQKSSTEKAGLQCTCDQVRGWALDLVQVLLQAHRRVREAAQGTALIVMQQHI